MTIEDINAILWAWKSLVECVSKCVCFRKFLCVLLWSQLKFVLLVSIHNILSRFFSFWSYRKLICSKITHIVAIVINTKQSNKYTNNTRITFYWSRRGRWVVEFICLDFKRKRRINVRCILRSRKSGVSCRQEVNYSIACEFSKEFKKN